MRRHAASAVAILASILVAGIGERAVAAAWMEKIEIPHADRVVELSQILCGAAEALGVRAPALDTLGDAHRIEIDSPEGRARLGAITRATRGAITVLELPDCLLLDIDRSRLDAAVGRTRESVQTWFETVSATITHTFTQRTSPETAAWGITVVTDEDERVPFDVFAQTHPVPRRMVVLVHGLDDPGWMWTSLIAAARQAGHVVARMTYPNDGPIADSADLMTSELRTLRTAGVDRVDVVAHSMGGLVSRDVLTRGEHYGGNGRGSRELPAIDRLIMCGTPNHGSNMARLRGVSEIHEQVSRAFTGDAVWLGGLADGTGEAATDLLPDSAFLRDLNARSRPGHTQYSIIAGSMSPVSTADVTAIGRELRDVARSARAPKWLRRFLRDADSAASGLLDEAVVGLGDGCVSISSARLDGVDDFVIVEANHVSMLASVLPGFDTPPAVALIVKRLGPME